CAEAGGGSSSDAAGLGGCETGGDGGGGGRGNRGGIAGSVGGCVRRGNRQCALPGDCDGYGVVSVFQRPALHTAPGGEVDGSGSEHRSDVSSALSKRAGGAGGASDAGNAIHGIAYGGSAGGDSCDEEGF